MRSAVVLAAAVVLAPAALGASTALPAPVTVNGVGGVVPGMTPEQVEDRWGVPIVLPDNVHSLGCDWVGIEAGGMRGLALFESGRLGAVFFDRGARTDAGVRIGSTVRELRRAYGRRLTSRPDVHVRGARHYFVTRPRAPRWELRFDVSPHGRVTRIGFGAEPVRFFNGCN